MTRRFFSSPLLVVLLALLAVLTLSVSVGDLAARTYTWRDKNGAVHITDKPPPGTEAPKSRPRATSRPGGADAASPQSAGAQGTGPIFLWKVAQAKGASWLLGSIHCAPPGMYPLDSRIEAAFAASDTLAVEADISGPGSLKAQALVQQLGFYPEGDSLWNHVSAATKEKLTRAAGHLPNLERMKPWLVGLQMQQLKTMQLGCDMSMGLDMHFLNKARAGGKTIVELESIEYQLRLFDELASGNEDSYLSATLEETHKLDSMLKEIFQLWKRGDAGGLAKLIMSSSNEVPGFMDKMFYNRNRGMADKVEGLLAQGRKVFVVVGAGHLVGEKSVVELLAGKGSGVEQVK